MTLDLLSKGWHGMSIIITYMQDGSPDEDRLIRSLQENWYHIHDDTNYRDPYDDYEFPS